MDHSGRGPFQLCHKPDENHAMEKGSKTFVKLAFL